MGFLLGSECRVAKWPPTICSMLFGCLVDLSNNKYFYFQSYLATDQISHGNCTLWIFHHCPHSTCENHPGLHWQKVRYILYWFFGFPWRIFLKEALKGISFCFKLKDWSEQQWGASALPRVKFACKTLSHRILISGVNVTYVSYYLPQYTITMSSCWISDWRVKLVLWWTSCSNAYNVVSGVLKNSWNLSTKMLTLCAVSNHINFFRIDS